MFKKSVLRQMTNSKIPKCERSTKLGCVLRTGFTCAQYVPVSSLGISSFVLCLNGGPSPSGAQSFRQFGPRRNSRSLPPRQGEFPAIRSLDPAIRSAATPRNPKASTGISQHFSQTKQNRTRMNADLADDHRLSSPLSGITAYATDYLSSGDLIRENPFNLCSSAFYFLSWLKRYEHRTTCVLIIATHAGKASSIFGRPAALPRNARRQGKRSLAVAQRPRREGAGGQGKAKRAPERRGNGT